MKTIKNYVLVMMLLLFVAACDDNDSTSDIVSNEEAADMVASSLAESSSGMTTVVEDVTATADIAYNISEGGRTAGCGYSKSIDLSKSNREGSIVTYNYDYSYDYSMTCDNENNPIELTSAVEFAGSFDAPRMASNHTGDSELNVSTLDEASSSYLVNGSYSRTGSFESKIHNKNTSNSTITITIDEITVDEESEEIISGTASVNITGEVPGKGGFTFSGSIVFEGNGQATLTVDKTIYTVDLESGEID